MHLARFFTRTTSALPFALWHNLPKQRFLSSTPSINQSRDQLNNRRSSTQHSIQTDKERLQNTAPFYLTAKEKSQGEYTGYNRTKTQSESRPRLSEYSLRPKRNYEWYTKQFHALRDEEKPVDAMKLLQGMKVIDRLVPMDLHYSLVLSNLSNNGYTHKCFQLIQTMVKEGRKPAAGDYISVLRSCVYKKPFQLEQAEELFADLAAKMVPLPLDLLTEMMKIYIKAELPHDGLQIFEEFKSKTDIQTHIQSLAKLNAENSDSLTENNRETNKPINRFFKTALEICSLTKDQKIAESIIAELKRIHLKSDIEMYHHILSAYINDLEKCKSTIDEMRSHKIWPTADTGKILLKVHKGAKKEDYIGREFIDDLRAMRIKPDLQLYEMIFSEYAQFSKVPEIRPFHLLLGHMKQDQIHPSVDVWRAYLYLALRLRNESEMGHVMEKLRTMSAPLDVWAYLGILRLLRQGRDYINGGPNFKHGVHALLMMDELGLWFPEMDIHIPGRGRWLPLRRRHAHYSEMVADMKEKYLKDGPTIEAVRRQMRSPSSQWKDPIPKDPPPMPHLHHFANMPPSHVFRGGNATPLKASVPNPSVRPYQTNYKINQFRKDFGLGSGRPAEGNRYRAFNRNDSEGSMN